MRRRVVLRFAALVVAGSALGAAYWYTRPPELVWWRSPPTGNLSRHVKVLIPSGWEIVESTGTDLTGTSLWSYYAYPADKWPVLLRRIMPGSDEIAGLLIFVNSDIKRNHAAERPRRYTRPVGGSAATRARSAKVTYGIAYGVNASDGEFCAMISYYRINLPAFNRTCKQICDSLTIE